MNKTEYETSRAWVELDLCNLRSNVIALQKLLPPSCELMPVLKANAYGHGAVPIAKELQEMGIQAFCVATITEGIELRSQGIGGTILILGYTDPELAELLCRYRLTQSVVDYAYATQLNSRNIQVSVHLAVDTGMHRSGIWHGNREEILEILQMSNLLVEGIYTHLCADDVTEEPYISFTKQQAVHFWSLVRDLRSYGLSPKPHLLSSYGLLNYPQLGGAYLRAGIALYGVLSTEDDQTGCALALSPVLSVKARIASIRRLREGESAGYGMEFVAAHETSLATIAIGYADGLPRCLSCGVGSVLIHGCRAPIAGRICMDQMMVDVSGIAQVHAGDCAVIIGTSEKQTITAAEIAAKSGTISNEILCRLSTRLPRMTEINIF